VKRISEVRTVFQKSYVVAVFVSRAFFLIKQITGSQTEDLIYST